MKFRVVLELSPHALKLRPRSTVTSRLFFSQSAVFIDVKIRRILVQMKVSSTAIVERN